jgi:hypothetical protein
MNDKHAPHRSSRIIPHPLLSVSEIGHDPCIRIPFGNTLDDEFDECVGVACCVGGAVRRQGARDDFCQGWGIKVVESGLHLRRIQPWSRITEEQSTHTHILEPETQCNDHGQEDPEAGPGEPSGPEGRVWWFDVCAGNDPASARRSVDDHLRRGGDAGWRERQYEAIARCMDCSSPSPPLHPGRTRTKSRQKSGSITV